MVASLTLCSAVAEGSNRLDDKQMVLDWLESTKRGAMHHKQGREGRERMKTVSDKPETEPSNAADSTVKPVREPAKKPLSAAAKRALAEAKARREAADAEHLARQKELQGREGPDPVRYGDWENKGIASDF